MKIKQIIEQYRRDFTAEYECEGCGHVQTGKGYDDENFHNNVIPHKVQCEACGKTGQELGVDYRPLRPKYPEGYQI